MKGRDLVRETKEREKKVKLASCPELHRAPRGMRPAFNIYCGDVRSELKHQNQNQNLDHFKLSQEYFEMKISLKWAVHNFQKLRNFYDFQESSTEIHLV